MGYMLTTDMDTIDAIHLRNQVAQAQQAHQLGLSLEGDLPPWCGSGRSSPAPDDLCSQPPAALPFSTPEHLEIALHEPDPFSPLPSGPVPISPELSPLQTTFPHRPAPPLGPMPSPFATGSIPRAADAARGAPQLGLAPITVPLPADPELVRFRRATFNATPSAPSQRASHCLCRRCNPHSVLAPSTTTTATTQPWMAAANPHAIEPAQTIPGAPTGTFHHHHHHHHHCTCSAAPAPPPPPRMIPRTMSLDSGARATRDGDAVPAGVSDGAGRHHWDVPWSPPVSMFEFDSDGDDEQLDSESEAELLSWGMKDEV